MPNRVRAADRVVGAKLQRLSKTTDRGGKLHPSCMLRAESTSVVHHPDRIDRLGIHNAYWTHSHWTSQKPLWCILPFLVMTAWAPWIRWSNRFTLRALLIATTLVAVMLGLIVWSVR